MEAEINNSTFYSLIRSNNVDSLKNWFKIARMEPKAVHLFLGAAYEELHLKNVPISREMQFEVEWRLLELQFVTEGRKRLADSKTTFKQIKEHLDLTCGLINSFLVKYYKTKSKLDLSFVLDAKFVALHISVLKRWLDTYKKIPWEEMESCLVFLILTITRSNKAELTYQFVLDTDRVLNHLHYFSEEIVNLQSWFKDAETIHPGEDSKQLKRIKDKLEELNIKGLPKGRYGAKETILKSSPELKDLYEDFYLLRDVFSLKRIKHYLETALSVDLDADPTIGSLVIQRALQVVGEFLKNESESPNISEGLYLILVKLVKVSMQSTFQNLRNYLSHLDALRKRLELEETTDKNLFKSIQIDFKTINAEITRVLYQRKIDALKVLLQKILQCTTFEEMNTLLQYVDINKLDELNVIEVPSLSFVKHLVLMFWQEIKKTIMDFKDVDQVIEAINRYESRIEEVAAMYKTVIKAIFRISKTGKLIKSQCLAQSSLNTLNNLDPKGIFEEIFGFLQIIYNNYKKLRGIELDDTTSSDKELLRVTKILMKIHDSLKWDLQTIKGVEEISTALKSEETDYCYWKEKMERLFNQIKEKLDISDKNIFWSDVEKKQNIHIGKIMLLKSMKQEDFKEKLAQLELENKDTETVLLNSYNKAKHNKKKYEELKERINGRISDEYGLMLKNLEKNGSIFPLDKYFKALNNFFSTVFSKNQKLVDKITLLITDLTIQEIQIDYNKRLSTLNKVNASVADFQIIEHNSSVVAALEILILDLTEYLVKTNSLHDNKALLVEKLPLLNGKQLRNHLAHESIVTYILPYDTDIPVFLYTQGLVNLSTKIITQMGRWTVGFKSCDNDMSKYVNKCQSTVKLQYDLFHSIEDGCFDDTLTLIRAGADLYGRNEIGLTTLDISVKNENQKYTHYFMTNLMKNEKDNNIFQYVSPYTIMKNWETFIYFLHNTNLNINFICENNATLLHIASEIGQFEIVEFLLKHMTKTNHKTNFAETALHLAVRNGHLNIVLLLLEHNANVIDHQTNRGATALHIASENGYCDLFNELIGRGADFSLKTLENYNAFELAVRSGHQHIVSMFLSLHKNEILSEERVKALSLASLWGHSTVIETLFELNINVDAKTSALFNAATFGYVDVVKLLLKSGANVNSKHLNDATPLHVACSNGHLEIVKILLNENADINARDEKMWSPLHYACKKDHLEIINLLILKCDKIWSVDAGGLTPFHVAAENGCIASLQLLLQKYPDAVNYLTENTGLSALHLAAGKGHAEIVKLLLTRGAKVNSLATNKTSPFHWAIQRHGYINVVTTLIEYEADINLQNNQGATPLHTAVVNQNETILKMLLSHGADPKITNKSMYTPLHLAAMNWNRNIVNELLKLVDDVNIRDHVSQTPLHVAATYGCAEIVEMLLVKSANCNLFDINHVAPLHLAAYEGHLDVAKLLVDYGARINERDNIHRSPLFMAVSQCHEELAMFLIQKGADVKQRLNQDVTIFSSSINKGLTNVVSEIIKSDIDINESSCQRKISPLIMALLGGHDLIALVLLEQVAINVLTSSKSGWTALHVACAKGFKTCVDKMLTLRPDINARSEEQETPLHFAAEKGHHDIVKRLIEHGAEIDAISESAYPTALSCAVRNGHQNVAATLIQHGANVNIKCHRGTTPLQIAILAEYIEMTKIILACERTLINAQADGSWTALHFAALKGNSIILNTLLERDVTDMINAITDDGNTALHYASYQGHREIVEMLIGHNADVSIRNLDGLTGEDIACRERFDDIVLLYKKISICNTTL